MLVLSRKSGQSIMIGDEIEVHVLAIGDGKVRLGVTGPARVPVHQRERYEARRRVKGAFARAPREGMLASSGRGVSHLVSAGPETLRKCR